MAASRTLIAIAARLREARTRARMEPEELEKRLIIGPGWVASFEAGLAVPSLDMLLALLGQLDVDPARFFDGIELPASGAAAERQLYAERDGDDLLLRFRYAEHDATYRLQEARLSDLEAVLQELRDGLSPLANAPVAGETAVKTNAVAGAFLKSVQLWPHANPSDLWWFLVYRAYCDPFNHPAKFARMDLAQSWKRTGGWALEEVLVRFYGAFLRTKGINVFVARGQRKADLLSQLRVSERLEPDKVDVLLSGTMSRDERCFGVVHVKSSFAERRTDDVPLSRALVRAGYSSPLWTMDCKSGPSKAPVNKGELGPTRERGVDRRSAKRKDIEDDGYFSACFSYNLNTVPTPARQRAKARVFVSDFTHPDDEFARFVVGEWERFRGLVTRADVPR